MIFDSIHHIRLYMGISDQLDKALQCLAGTDFSALPPGRYEVDGDSVYYLVQEPAFKAFEETRWEAHRRYTDIQFAIAPGEVIGCADMERLDGRQPYDAENDIQFFSSEEKGIALPMQPGCFAVFFPTDAHRPLQKAGDAAFGRKVVFKVKA